jgi:RNA polymerase subunit RPABC4/transcription elongation factor Spt4
MIDTAGLSNAALIIVTLLGMYLSAFWLALVIWAFRDHRARSRDTLASIAAALMVGVLFLPGLLVYLLLRPRETLAEAYERSLEEEALLQEIEEKPVCPGCGRPSDPEWQVCPHCHTTLKKACVQCQRMLDLAWHQCPYCAAVQPNFSGQAAAPAGRQQARPAAPAYEAPPPPQQDAYTPQDASLEFIDDDPYRR